MRILFDNSNNIGYYLIIGKFANSRRAKTSLFEKILFENRARSAPDEKLKLFENNII